MCLLGRATRQRTGQAQRRCNASPSVRSVTPPPDTTVLPEATCCVRQTRQRAPLPVHLKTLSSRSVWHGVAMRAAARSAIHQPALTHVARSVALGRAPSAPRWLGALLLLQGAQSVATQARCSARTWPPAGVTQPRLARFTPSAAAGRSLAAMAGEAASSTGAVVMYTTVPSRAVGEAIATALVEGRLAACVSLIGSQEGGMTSIYMWEGKVNKDPEILLMIKTRASLVDALTAKVKELHPYDEPEVIAVPIVGGSASYLQWIQDTANASSS